MQHLGQYALCLAQGIAEQHRILTAFAVDLPPAHNVANDRGRVGPDEVRLSERRLADKYIKGALGWNLPGVCNRPNYPYFSVMLEAHLGGAEDKAGGMQRGQ